MKHSELSFERLHRQGSRRGDGGGTAGAVAAEQREGPAAAGRRGRGGYVPSPTFVVLVTAGLCGLAWLPAPAGGDASWALFLGRFHVALIHLPIGLVFGLAAVEMVHGLMRGVDLRPASWVLLWMTALSAGLAVVLGTLLALSGGYDERLLRWHRIAGTGMAVLVFWTLVLRLRHRAAGDRAAHTLSFLCLAGAVAAAGPAGHFGGSLTHGSGYLAQHMPAGLRRLVGPDPGEAPPAPAPDPAPALAFADRVLPILDRYCVSCHGPDKQKAGLRVDGWEALREGGYEGPAIVPGDPARSLIVQAMRLPASDEFHMPPDGKPQPAPGEIALIAAWIEAGASDTLPASALDTTAAGG